MKYVFIIFLFLIFTSIEVKAETFTTLYSSAQGRKIGIVNINDLQIISQYGEWIFVRTSGGEWLGLLYISQCRNTKYIT